MVGLQQIELSGQRGKPLARASPGHKCKPSDVTQSRNSVIERSFPLRWNMLGCEIGAGPYPPLRLPQIVERQALCGKIDGVTIRRRSNLLKMIDSYAVPNISSRTGVGIKVGRRSTIDGECGIECTSRLHDSPRLVELAQ